MCSHQEMYNQDVISQSKISQIKSTTLINISSEASTSTSSNDGLIKTLKDIAGFLPEVDFKTYGATNVKLEVFIEEGVVKTIGRFDRIVNPASPDQVCVRALLCDSTSNVYYINRVLVARPKLVLTFDVNAKINFDAMVKEISKSSFITVARFENTISIIPTEEQIFLNSISEFKDKNLCEKLTLDLEDESKAEMGRLRSRIVQLDKESEVLRSEKLTQDEKSKQIMANHANELNEKDKVIVKKDDDINALNKIIDAKNNSINSYEKYIHCVSLREQGAKDPSVRGTGGCCEHLSGLSHNVSQCKNDPNARQEAFRACKNRVREPYAQRCCDYVASGEPCS